MTIVVVVWFEMIYIYHQQRQLMTVSLGQHNLTSQHILEVAAVVDLSETIGNGEQPIVFLVLPLPTQCLPRLHG